jgi:cytochrome c-type biogenesis protein CcmH
MVPPKRRLCVLALLLGGLWLAAAAPAHAVEPSEMLSDPALEQRARHISEGLRCLVCQNQSIDDSNAALARDLRVLVRQRLVAGDSDEQVRAYLVSRYGDFVLLNPPFASYTFLLWFAPVLVLGAAVMVLMLRFRHRAAQTVERVPVPLSPEERQGMDRILSQGRDGQ